MRQLSGTDTTMLYSDRPHAQNVIAPIGIYDGAAAPGGPVTFDAVLDFIRARLDISASFRERIVRVPFGLDRPYWIRDADFDLEYHVREISLPAPGDWTQFCTQIARISSRPLDLSRPPWELYIIGGLDGIKGVPEGAFAMMLRLHHAAVDGVAGAEMLTVLHDTEAEAADRNREHLARFGEEWAPEAPPSASTMLARATINAVVRPTTLRRLLGPALRGARMGVFGLPERGLPPISGAITATRFNTEVSPHRSFGVARFDLASIKRIRTAVPGLKVNDVALALVGGAMRRYLDAKGELPNEPLVALMPISVRPTLTQRSKSGVSIDGAAPDGNQFAMLPVSMATDVVDLRARLRAIQHATQAAKSIDAVSARGLMEISELLPGALTGTVQRALVRTLNRRGRSIGTHTIVTNVPGPQSPVYFCGARAVMMTGIAPVLDGMGLMNAVGSYDGDVPVSFTSCRAMMPDPAFYEECLHVSFDELLSLAANA